MASPRQVAGPPKDRVRSYQQQEVAQLLPWEVVEQTGEDRPVGVGERRLVDLALKDQQLVSQGQDFDVLVPVTHR